MRRSNCRCRSYSSRSSTLQERRAHALKIWASRNETCFQSSVQHSGAFWSIWPAGAAIFDLILPGVRRRADFDLYRSSRKLLAAWPQARIFFGQVLAVAAIGGLAFAAIEGSHWGWTSLPILTIAALGLAAGVAFFLFGKQLDGALVPLDLFSNREFSSALSTGALITFGMYALLFLMPLYFQTMRGASLFLAGLQMLPMSISFVLVSQLTRHMHYFDLLLRLHRDGR